MSMVLTIPLRTRHVVIVPFYNSNSIVCGFTVLSAVNKYVPVFSNAQQVTAVFRSTENTFLPVLTLIVRRPPFLPSFVPVTY